MSPGNGGINKPMLYCTFYNKLKKLNPRLRIYGDDTAPSRPRGLYVVDKLGMSQKHICGISANGGMVYELTERRWDGYILRQGWRRVVKMLVKQGIVDQKKAGYEFGTSFSENQIKGYSVEKDPLTRAWAEAKQRGFEQTGIENYVSQDDLVDIHRWREKLRKDKTNYWA